MTSPSSVRVALLGELQVTADGVIVPVPVGGRGAFLMCLALAAPRSLSRAQLMTALWGEAPPSSAVNAVQVHVSALRKALGRDVILTAGDGYRLHPDVRVDVAEFDALVRRGEAESAAGRAASAAESLRAALALWRGSALSGAAEVPFAAMEAARLAEARLTAVEMRAEADLACSRAAQLVPELEVLVQENPYRESLLGLLMQALYGSGRQADALTAYEAGRRRLAEELGLDMSPPLRDLHQRLLEQSMPVSPTQSYRLAAPLPAILDRTIGRDAELTALGEVLRGGARLVTVVGPGGVGKTRLAVELAHQLETYRDGVVFVPLAEATRAEDVATTLCAALGLLVTEDAAQTLERGLAAHDSVLICDNFEHVVAAASLLERLLAAAPNIRIVVTSRQLLGVRGERPFPLAPLDPSRAGELLLVRIREADPSFVPTEVDDAAAEAIAALCDGLPLALELAAGRARVLSLAEVRAGVTDPLALSAVGAHSRPDRHRTMRGNIAWSVDALSVREAVFLSSLTVFRGGFTAAAAAAVAGLSLDETVAALAALVDGSLVQRAPAGTGERRFDLLETVREFAAESLDPAQRDTVRRRHAEFFRDFLQPPPDPGVLSATAEVWLAKVAERSNIREAIRFALDGTDPGLAADLVIGAAALWFHAGSRPDLTGWLDALLERPDTAAPRRCDALIWLSILWGDDDPGGYVATLTEALAVADATGDPRRRAFALWQFSLNNRTIDLERGLACATEALEIARSLPDAAVLECCALNGLGIVSCYTDPDLALSYMRDSADIAREHRMDLRLLIVINNLAELHLQRNEPELAHECAAEGVELALRAQSALGLADNLGQRGTSMLLMGRTAEAEIDLSEAARALTRLGQTYFAVHCLERFAAAVADDRPGLAALALAVVDSSPEYHPEVFSTELRRRFLDHLPDRLGNDRLAEVKAEGAALVARLDSAGAVAAVLDSAG